MVKKNLVLLSFMCTLWVNNSDALCCFRTKKKADDRLLEKIKVHSARTKELKSPQGRQSCDLEELHLHERRLKAAVRNLQTDVAYKKFLEIHNHDVISKSKNSFYADDKKEAGRLAGNLVPQQWQKGWGPHIEENRKLGVFCIKVYGQEEKPKPHVLVSPTVRIVFDSEKISSLRVMAPENLRAVALLYRHENRPKNLVIVPEEQRTRKEYMQQNKISPEVDAIADRGELLLIPVVG